jgi:hypothetical protein
MAASGSRHAPHSDGVSGRRAMLQRSPHSPGGSPGALHVVRLHAPPQAPGMNGARTSPCVASLTAAPASCRASRQPGTACSCCAAPAAHSSRSGGAQLRYNDQLPCPRRHARSVVPLLDFFSAAGGHPHAAGELRAGHGVEPRRHKSLLHRLLTADMSHDPGWSTWANTAAAGSLTNPRSLPPRPAPTNSADRLDPGRSSPCSFGLISTLSSHPVVFFSHNKPANSIFSTINQRNEQAERM